MSEIGIKYDFFVPVDVPEELADKLGTQVTTVKNEAGVKAAKDKESITDKKKIKKESETATEKKTVTVNNKNEKTGVKQVAIKCSGGKQTGVDVKKQTNKEQKNVKGMKPLEDFVKIEEDSEDSEGSDQFDSDEFEMLANENDSASEDASLTEDDDDESEDDHSDDER